MGNFQRAVRIDPGDGERGGGLDNVRRSQDEVDHSIMGGVQPVQERHGLIGCSSSGGSLDGETAGHFPGFEPAEAVGYREQPRPWAGAGPDRKEGILVDLPYPTDVGGRGPAVDDVRHGESSPSSAT